MPRLPAQLPGAPLKGHQPRQPYGPVPTAVCCKPIPRNPPHPSQELLRSLALHRHFVGYSKFNGVGLQTASFRQSPYTPRYQVQASTPRIYGHGALRLHHESSPHRTLVDRTPVNLARKTTMGRNSSHLTTGQKLTLSWLPLCRAHQPVCNNPMVHRGAHSGARLYRTRLRQGISNASRCKPALRCNCS